MEKKKTASSVRKKENTSRVRRVENPSAQSSNAPAEPQRPLNDREAWGEAFKEEYLRHLGQSGQAPAEPAPAPIPTEEETILETDALLQELQKELDFDEKGLQLESGKLTLE